MKKMPTLFVRDFSEKKKIILDQVTPECEWVLKGEGYATEKIDGACCTIIKGELYKRYDAKKGKPIPEGAILCQPAADPITGHWPCWVKCNRDLPEDKWFWSGYDNSSNSGNEKLPDGTYEAVGPHFRGNPYNYEKDFIKKHGTIILDVPDRTFEGIKTFLSQNEIEGIVFYRPNGDMCKIKRTDFGFEWNSSKKK